MLLVVGLGNPGKKYQKTRHNVGWLTLDALKSKIKDFSDWQKAKKFMSEISQGEIAGQKVILAKPQTLMNNSGKAVKSLLAFHKTAVSNLIVVHDDVDLLLGKIKISVGHGSAGHKGVESIINELKTKDFVRFRVGIKPEKIDEEKEKQKTGKFVLANFSKKEENILKKSIKKTIEAIELTIEKGLEKTQNTYNK